MKPPRSRTVHIWTPDEIADMRLRSFAFNFLELLTAFQAATDQGKESFILNGEEINTNYACYLIQLTLRKRFPENETPPNPPSGRN